MHHFTCVLVCLCESIIVHVCCCVCGHAPLCVCAGVCEQAPLCICAGVSARTIMCACCCVCGHAPLCVCADVSVCAYHCACVLVPPSVCARHRAHVLLSARPLALPPPTAARPAGNSPRAPSLLSFIIICHEREPRRTVINKGHLKYETTTLTLGNISSVEQLVPPLSLWKGVPGAAAPARLPRALSSLLPPPPLPSRLWSWRAWEGLGGLGREWRERTPRPVPQCKSGWASACPSSMLCERLGVR